MVAQREIVFKDKMIEDVSDSIVEGCPALKSAIRLTIEVSTLERKQIADVLDINEGQLSRMLNNGANFPPEKINGLMDLCGNEIPLRWLAMRRGYRLYRLKSTIEIENEALKQALLEKEREIEVIKKFLKETGR